MKLRLFLTSIVVAMLLVTGCNGKNESKHDNDRDHAQESGHETENAHGDHHDEESGEHDEEAEIAIAPEDMKMTGITTAKAQTGRISTFLELSGEVGFNEDRLVHITPRFPGIIKEVRYRIGEYVKAGEIVAVLESNESMTTYSLKASISGRIVEKHAAVGEHVSEEESLFLLADLSTVWVNLAVYPKDANRIKQGQKATIVAVGSENSTIGTLSYITPVMDPQTRKITARVVLPNGNNLWRPGTFVNAIVEIGEGEPGLVVERNAVQMLDNESVIFVQHEPGRFEPVQVKIGEKNSSKVMILSGLAEGQEYVNNGAFELKAKIVTSSLGGHAGHGH